MRIRFRRLPLLAAVAITAIAALAASAAAASAAATSAATTSAASWPSGSQNINGNRNQPLETTINPSNASQLSMKWVFTDHGDVSATPTVAGGVVYFPDWGGYLNAVDAATGQTIWQRPISDYDGEPGAVSRNSPLILGNDLILGDNASFAQSGGAHLVAVDRTTGNLVWSSQVDSHPAAIVTSNPVAIGGQIIVGIASNEENDATQASYPCCTFRGSVVAVNASNGHIIWKTYTIPPNSGPCTHDDPTNGPSGCGFSGGAVWATPTVDPQTNEVFVGTGNNYTATDAANACETNAQQTQTSDSSCTPSNDYFDSVLALNMSTGKIVWGDKVQGWDAWNVACAYGAGTWCPSIYSPDWDFGGSSPNLFTAAGGEKLVGDGQKSGVYWAFDEKTGKIVWHTLVGPGARSAASSGEARSTAIASTSRSRTRSRSRTPSPRAEGPAGARGPRSTRAPGRSCGRQPYRATTWPSGRSAAPTGSCTADRWTKPPPTRPCSRWMLPAEASSGATPPVHR